jgi:hypothetical protein
MKLNRNEIMQKMAQLKEEEVLKFTIPEIFGGGVAIISLNPNFPKQGEKKYLLKLGSDEKLAGEAAPYWPTDNPKDLAKWVADRLGDQIIE